MIQDQIQISFISMQKIKFNQILQFVLHFIKNLNRPLLILAKDTERLL